MADTIEVLFLCTDNACRSQMAEGWTRQLRSDTVVVTSAGIESSPGVNPFAIQVMAEAGVDISSQTSQPLSNLSGRRFDYVVLLCPESGEFFPRPIVSGKVLSIVFDDPPKMALEFDQEERKIDCYRKVRDQIRNLVEAMPERLFEEQGA